jgi:hypothetical protein
MQIPPGTPTTLHFVGPKKRLDFAEKHQGILKSLIRLESFSFAEKETPLPFASTTTINDLKLIIPLPSEIKKSPPSQRKGQANRTAKRSPCQTWQSKLRSESSSTTCGETPAQSPAS